MHTTPLTACGEAYVATGRGVSLAVTFPTYAATNTRHNLVL
jgi:hypothetical protein